MGIENNYEFHVSYQPFLFYNAYFVRVVPADIGRGACKWQSNGINSSDAFSLSFISYNICWTTTDHQKPKHVYVSPYWWDMLHPSSTTTSPPSEKEKSHLSVFVSGQGKWLWCWVAQVCRKLKALAVQVRGVGPLMWWWNASFSTAKALTLERVMTVTVRRVNCTSTRTRLGEGRRAEWILKATFKVKMFYTQSLKPITWITYYKLLSLW